MRRRRGLNKIAILSVIALLFLILVGKSPIWALSIVVLLCAIWRIGILVDEMRMRKYNKGKGNGVTVRYFDLIEILMYIPVGICCVTLIVASLIF